MHVTQETRSLFEDIQTIHLHRPFESNHARLIADIVIESNTMVEFQREIFEELLGWLAELLSSETLKFGEFKEAAEYAFQETNLQLQAFAEKTAADHDRNIRGAVQCIVNNDYLAVLIGKTWLVIMRRWNVHYMLTNDDAAEGIDQFSELVEWEVRTGDELLSVGFPIQHYLDSADMTTISQTAIEANSWLLDEMMRTLSVRVDDQAIGFMDHTILTSEFVHTTQEVTKRFQWPLTWVTKRLGWTEKAKIYGMYSMIGILAIILLVSIMGSFSETNDTTFVSTTTGNPVPITIEAIQKDIADFQNMDPTSEQKWKTYEEIVMKLDILDDNDKWLSDVSELRKVLETQYYQGFNILLVNNESFFKDPIYSFTQQEKNVLWVPQQVLFSENLMVSGEEGVLVGAINETLRGTLVSAAIDQEFDDCVFNLFRNGLYCVDSTNQIYMISKSWVELITTKDGQFSNDVVKLWRYRNKNLYTLTNDPLLNADGIYISRYTNVDGTQTEFSEGLQYPLIDPTSAGSGIQEMTIDGTFMVWDPSAGLTQRWREGVSTNLQHRTFDLGWWSLLERYSDDTKVISSEDSRYVYLFDAQGQTFTVYRSLPYKTNDAHTTDYTLTYFFRVKFAIDDFDVLDVYVEEGEQAILHILTLDGVYKLRLGEYRNDYMARIDG